MHINDLQRQRRKAAAGSIRIPHFLAAVYGELYVCRCEMTDKMFLYRRDRFCRPNVGNPHPLPADSFSRGHPAEGEYGRKTN